MRNTPALKISARTSPLLWPVQDLVCSMGSFSANWAI